MIKYIVLILLLFSSHLAAQSLHIKNYTSSDGLPSIQVWCSLQDSKGYIWFGTTSGLVKFNGVEFVVYSVEDGLINSAVRSLLEDNGFLWVTTHSGISRFDGNSFMNFTTGDGLGKGIIRSAAKYKGCLWFGTSEGGLSRLDPGESAQEYQITTFTTKDGLPGNSVFPLLSHGKYLWIGTRGGGLSRFDGTTFINFGEREGLPAKDIWCLINEGSTIWIGTGDRGLYKYENGQFVNVMPDGRFYCAAKDNFLWFGTLDKGVWRVKNGFINYTTANGLIGNHVYSILIDRENTVWFTTNKGISKLISTKFITYLKDKVVLSACMFKDAMWFGTMTAGLIKIKNEILSSYTVKNGLSSNQVWSLASIKDKLWIGTYEGLNCFNGKTFKKYTVGKDSTSNIITDLLPLHNFLWIATAGGVAKFDGETFTRFTTKDGLPTNHIWSICQDGDNIWFATYSGASRYDGMHFRTYTTEDGLPTNNIRNIFKDSNGLLWFGTDLGIVRFDNKTFTSFTTKDGLSNNNISSILEYKKNLWLGTDKGLDCFRDGKVIRIFTQKSGLIGDESATNNSLCLDNQQNIWFGSTLGLTRYRPRDDIPNTVQPPIYITKLFVNDVLVKSKQNLEFKYDQNNVAFYYNGLSFKDERDVRYKYRLEGYDRDWSDITAKSEVRYTNLNDGNYIFKVAAQNGDGYWSEIPAELSFIILPPYWKNDWFIIIISVVVILMIYGILRFQTAHIRNRAVALEHRVNERTKELQESEETYRTMIEHSNDMIWALDEKGNFIYFNMKSEEITGHKIKQGVGHSFAPLIFEEDLDMVKSVFVQTMQGKPHHYEVRIYDSEKKILFLSVNTAPIFKDRKVVGTISFGRDVTEHKKMEEELLKVSKLDSLGILAGGIAHDFNNILTAIIGNISLAKLHSDPEEKIFKTLGKVEEASHQAKDLTQQLLTFARGGVPVKKVTSIKTLVKDSAIFALRGSNVRCEILIPDDLWFVEVDEGQIVQVVNNLIINADQAMPGGGVAGVYAENIIIDEQSALPLEKGNYVKISVEDKGIGIPPEHIQNIFDPYFSTKQKGRGLGLAIAFSIIKRHNGHITVESEAGVGTTFYIYLPASGKKVPAKKESRIPALRIVKGKVLVMDDDDVVRDVSSEMFTHMGYDFQSSKNGTEAIELYKKALESGGPFDVVILDLTIPGGMGGEETLKKLVEINPEVKAIVSSGYSDDPIISDFRAYGFSGVVSKPYVIQELSEVLYQVIKGNKKG